MVLGILLWTDYNIKLVFLLINIKKIFDMLILFVRVMILHFFLFFFFFRFILLKRILSIAWGASDIFLFCCWAHFSWVVFLKLKRRCWSLTLLPHWQQGNRILRILVPWFCLFTIDAHINLHGNSWKWSYFFWLKLQLNLFLLQISCSLHYYSYLKRD